MKTLSHELAFEKLEECTLGLQYSKVHRNRMRKYLRIRERIARIILSNVRKYNTARILFKQLRQRRQQKKEENIFDQIFN